MSTHHDHPAPTEESDVDHWISALLERTESPSESEVNALCREHPSHAAEIRRRIETLRRLGLFNTVAFPGVDSQAEPIPDQLGDFRVLSRLGGGGMGVVYLAEQRSLGREVALKLVRPEHLYFPSSRERFRREVEAVARLQHPGIVPIYTVGEERGIPFFAMERLRGATLGDLILHFSNTHPARLTGADLYRVICANAGIAGRGGQEAPPEGPELYRGPWTRCCVRIIRDVACALDHAHAKGVLHRDVKPSNIYVTTDGRTLLIDFGLAAAEGTSQLTRSGSQIGSVPYMPPEIVRGDLASVDARSDIYSLGVTLYELLTFHAPYFADSVDATHRAILDGEPVHPGKLNSAVSDDLATVCLAAMDRDRARRHQTAGDLARDLDNILERRPISVRPPGQILRARRWMERHPAQSVATALTAILLVGGLGEFAYLQYRHGIATDILYKSEQNQRRRAEHRYSLATGALERMLTRVGERELADAPYADGIRRKLIEDALEFSESLLRNHDTTPEALRERARALWRTGELRLQISEYQRAGEALAEATAIVNTLAEGPDGQAPHDILKSEILVTSADVAISTGKPGEAARLLSLADETMQRVRARAGEPAHTQHVQSFHVQTRIRLARALRADARFEQARDVLEKTQLESGDYLQRDAVASGDFHSEFASIERSRRDLPAAEKFARAALLSMESELQQFATSAYSRSRVRKAHHTLGLILSDLGRVDEALECHKQSLAHCEYLMTAWPATRSHAIAFAEVANSLALCYHSKGAFEEADIYYQKCINAHASHSAKDQGNVARAIEMATFVVNKSINDLELDRMDSATEALKSQLQQLEALAGAHPSSAELLESAGGLCNNLGILYSSARRPQDALEVHARGVGFVRAAVALAPESRSNRVNLAFQLNNLGCMERDLGSAGKARVSFMECIEILSGLATRNELKAGEILCVSEAWCDVAALDFEENACVQMIQNLDKAVMSLAEVCKLPRPSAEIVSRRNSLIEAISNLYEQAQAPSEIAALSARVKESLPDGREAGFQAASILARAAAIAPNENREALASRCIAQLEEIATLGFDDAAALHSSRVFDSLRSTPRFLSVLSTIKNNRRSSAGNR